jgi:hypothetical protein
VLAIVLLVAVSTAWAVLLRWTRCPGWSVVAGVAAGLMLGPTILGRVAPDLYSGVFDGGLEQARQLGQLSSQHGAERVAAHAAGATVETIGALERRQSAAIETATHLWRDARWTHQRPQRAFVAILAALTLSGAAAFAIPRSGRGTSVVTAVSVGAWSAALPGGIAWFMLRGPWQTGAVESMLVVAAVAIGPWALSRTDRDIADDAEADGARLVLVAGRVATLIAAGIVVAALVRAHGSIGLLWAAPLAAIPLGWMANWPAAEVARGALGLVIVPAVTATVAIRIDLLGDLRPWPVLILVLLSTDGRWLGAFTGAQILGGRRPMGTMRLVMASTAAGPTQIVVTAIAVSTWSIDTGLALALLLGAILIETTGPARRSVARRLEESH